MDTPKAPLIYLCGPTPTQNIQTFQNAAAALRAHSYKVVSPVESDTDSTPDEWSALVRSFPMVMAVDLLVLLPGWEHSREAAAQLFAARAVDVPACLLSDVLEHGADRAHRITFNLKEMDVV